MICLLSIFQSHITIPRSRPQQRNPQNQEEEEDEEEYAAAQAEIEDAKQRYLDDFKSREGVELDPSKIGTKNDGLRFISKLMLNGFWGYLGMRDNLPKTKYINSYAEIVKHFSSRDSIVTDMTLVGEDLAVLQYQAIGEAVESSPKTNVILAAFTTAHARTVLYGYMDCLDDPKRICYCDTDSIMYVQSSASQNTIQTGN